MMKNILIFFALSSCIVFYGQNEVYEIRTYELFQYSNFNHFNTYFKDHLIPILNQQGINNIGVFHEISKDLPRKIYVMIPYTNMDIYEKARSLLASNRRIQEASAQLSPFTKPIFNRYETYLNMAFDGMPQMVKPDHKNRFFELRTYESHSEDAYRRKINMFNEGELELFNQLDFGSVFFGDKIAGGRMPCLTYMLAFESMEERNENWAQFIDHPTWTKLKSDPAYKESCCSSITRAFLTSLPYSQL